MVSIHRSSILFQDHYVSPTNCEIACWNNQSFHSTAQVSILPLTKTCIMCRSLCFGIQQPHFLHSMYSCIEFSGYTLIVTWLCGEYNNIIFSYLLIYLHNSVLFCNALCCKFHINHFISMRRKSSF